MIQDMIQCNECAKFYNGGSGWRKITYVIDPREPVETSSYYLCPKCIAKKRRDDLPRLHCLRCGHEWIPRSERKPGTCPKCNSPYWDRPRKR